MANMKAIGQLTAKTTPASTDVFALEDTEDTKKINYDALADAILNKITSKNYTVAGSSQTLINAINTLNSKTKATLTISNNNISQAEAKIYNKIGHVVEVYLNFTVSAAITDTTTELFSGLPYAADYTRYAIFSVSTTAPKRIRVGIQRTSIYNAYTEGGIPAGQYEGTIVYLTES